MLPEEQQPIEHESTLPAIAQRHRSVAPVASKLKSLEQYNKYQVDNDSQGSDKIARNQRLIQKIRENRAHNQVYAPISPPNLVGKQAQFNVKAINTPLNRVQPKRSPR